MSPSTLLDVALGVVLVAYAVSGYRRGLVVGAFSLLGFLGGGALGIWLLPSLLPGWESVNEREVVRVAVLVLGVLLCACVGRGLALALGRRARSQLRAGPLRTADSLLGAVATVVAVSVLAWVIAGAVRPSAPQPLARAIGESRVLQAIDRVVPPETGRLSAGFGSILDQGGFPRVFQGVAPEPIQPVAPPDAGAPADPAVAAAARSVVKVTGVAQACRRGQEGSGWVVSPEKVVTNAHVVAGMNDAQVTVTGVGRSYRATPVVLDPQRDLAVLDVPGLAAPALRQGEALPAGANAMVAGFPLDGPFRLDPARVRGTLTATGSDIYGQPGASREIYSLFARVEPGNSGGPLLSPTGTVVGVVFAKSLDDDSTGYALTLREAQPVLEAAPGASARVPTGACSTG